MITREQTLANLVKLHPYLGKTFEKYHLDFCCNGKRKLSDACDELNLDTSSIESEIDHIIQSQIETNDVKPDQLTNEQLVNLIVDNHHHYVRENIPVIQQHLWKVATKHGDKFPYMIETFKLFQELSAELLSHLMKEENVLFPALIAKENGTSIPNAHLQGPISVMEHEHDIAGDFLGKIRGITNNFQPPANACNTFRLVLWELEAFEADLHQHIHLENNILFPRAELVID